MRRTIALVAATATIALCVLVGMEAAKQQPSTQEPPPKPNILFVLTDDQTTEDMANMTNVQDLLVDRGTTFSNAFATTPLCCPSRVSFMRGQYSHNHGVLANVGDQGGYDRFVELGLQDSTLATWLDEAGYATFYAGKFLNGYETTEVMPGWDEWYAFSGGHPSPEQYTVNENGTLKTYTQERQHETYYLRDKAERFIRERGVEKGPWFAWISTHAPHAPNNVAPDFSSSFDGAQMPKPPSYNEEAVSDKPAWIQEEPLLDGDCSADEGKVDCHKQMQDNWRARQEALMSVDSMVEDLVNTIAETGQMRRTYIVFASDNGYMLYQHRIFSKGVPYEEGQGIPLVVSGPGVQKGEVSKELVANIDLAPTVAEWAGVEAPAYVDGRSLVPLLDGTATNSWRQRLLFENWLKRKSYDGVRTAEGETYAQYRITGEEEYYDLRTDPWQLQSTHASPENAERIEALSEAILGLKNCAGAGCRAAEYDCGADHTDNDGDGAADEPGEPCGDPRPPQTTIDSGPPDPSRSRSATFTFSSEDPDVAAFECSLDSEQETSFVACELGLTYKGLSEGTHTFRVRAVDRAGNADPEPATRVWTVDTKASTAPDN